MSRPRPKPRAHPAVSSSSDPASSQRHSKELNIERESSSSLNPLPTAVLGKRATTQRYKYSADYDEEDEFFSRRPVIRKPIDEERRSHDPPLLSPTLQNAPSPDYAAVGASQTHKQQSHNAVGGPTLPLWTRARTRGRSGLKDGILDRSKEDEFNDRQSSTTPPPELDKERIAAIGNVVDRLFVKANVFSIDENDSVGELGSENCNWKETDAQGNERECAEDDSFADLDPELLMLTTGKRGIDLRKRLRDQQEANKAHQVVTASGHDAKSELLQAPNIPHQDSPISIQDSDEEGREKRHSRSSAGSLNDDYSFGSLLWNQSNASEHSKVIGVLDEVTADDAIVVLDSRKGINCMEEVNSNLEKELEECVTMTVRGGEGGNLSVEVRMKKNTSVASLEEFFIKNFRAKIPQEKLGKLKIQFDGENLSRNQTLGNLGIEDDDLVDIIW